MEKARNRAIDLWKFVFSVIIVILHGRNLRNGNEWYAFPGGNLGVEFFFVVSGLFMASSTLKPNNDLSLGKDTFFFMKRKILGLMPNVYVAWVIAFMVEHIGEYQLKNILEHFVQSFWELLLVTETGLRLFLANSVSWYLSAMLLGMLILYPLMKKYKDTFFYIIAPVGFIFMMGITHQEFNGLASPHVWTGLFYKGMLRAVMELLLGCICFKFGTFLSKIDFNYKGKICVSIIEWGAYLIAILYMFSYGGTKYDWIILFVLGIAISLTYSETGIMNKYIRSNTFSLLGEYSFSLYLGHGFWSHKMNYLFPNMSYFERMPIYLLISLVTGGIIMYLSKMIIKFWHKYRNNIKHFFIN